MSDDEHITKIINDAINPPTYRCECVEGWDHYRNINLYYKEKKVGQLSRIKNTETLTLDYEGCYLQMTKWFKVTQVIVKPEDSKFLDFYKNKMHDLLWLYIKKKDLDWLCYPYEANYIRAALIPTCDV